MRYATLVAEYLPKHPAAKDPENKKALKVVNRTIPDVLDRLEFLKPRIENRYTKWVELRASQRESAPSSRTSQGSSRPGSHEFADSDPAVAGRTRTLVAADHGDLAVQLAHKEIRRRDTARRATRQAGVSVEEEQERRTAGLWDNWETALQRNSGGTDANDLGALMQDTRRRMDNSRDEASYSSVRDGSRRSSKGPPPPPRPTSAQILDYRYPSVARSQPAIYDEPRPDSTLAMPNRPPPRPQKEALYPNDAPIRPAKEALSTAYQQEATPTPPEEAPEFTFTPSAYLENGSPLRTLFLPTDLRERFLDIARPNTRANLETCGILCGTLIRNALFISRLVIPEQESTSDTCDTVNESALFDFCDSEDLMVFGWIHTHPSQTCFMSSRDLHTHCGYQVVMPESIAIVCAPTKDPS